MESKMAELRADLHMHSKHSDGLLSVEELLRFAEQRALKLISITDHDTISAYDELFSIPNVSKTFSGQILTGVELSCIYNKIPIEILGYGIDIEKFKQTSLYKYLLEKDVIAIETRKLEYQKKIAKQYGLIYDPSLHITSENYKANDVLIDNLILYKENLEKLKILSINYDEKNMRVHRHDFYRLHFNNPESSFFQDRTEEYPDILQTINAIHEARGKAILAHPFLYEAKEKGKFIVSMLNLGVLDGIECGHNMHKKEQIHYLMNLANKFNLLITSGSDFHNLQTGHLGTVSTGNRQIKTNSMISQEIVDLDKPCLENTTDNIR